MVGIFLQLRRKQIKINAESEEIKQVNKYKVTDESKVTLNNLIIQTQYLNIKSR